jgi:hypothetical protein
VPTFHHRLLHRSLPAQRETPKRASARFQPLQVGQNCGVTDVKALSEVGGLILAHGQERTPGNTIRKVYLCRAKTTRLRPGDLLLFYMSKDDRYAASQSITTVGVVEQVIDVTTLDDLIRHTAKRSVFSADDLSGMNPSVNSAVKTIDFLLAGHIEPPVRLDALIRDGVFSSRPPQSIAELTEERYVRLKPLIQLGYNL